MKNMTTQQEIKESRLQGIVKSQTGKTTIVIIGVLGSILLIGITLKVLTYAVSNFKNMEKILRS